MAQIVTFQCQPERQRLKNYSHRDSAAAAARRAEENIDASSWYRDTHIREIWMVIRKAQGGGAQPG